MQATSPSTVQASPLSTPHPVPISNGNHPRRPADRPSRSSIACLRCRHSKVRCNNKGINTQCEKCAKANQACKYPESGAEGAAVRRPSISAGHDAVPSDRLGEAPRKRKRLAPSASFKDAAATASDILSPHLFTLHVWRELYAIFKQHYATDLPFLHEASFVTKLEQTDVQSMVDPFAPLVLAFLALTVPFHDGIVHQLSQGRHPTPVKISREYAEAADDRIKKSDALKRPSIQTVQALLMLGMHAHGDGQGPNSFITIGIAISCVEQLGCQFEQGLTDQQWNINRSIRRSEPRDSTLTEEERFIEEETRRRTFWSCFIMDRYMSSGKERRRRIRIEEEDTVVQLPCSDRAFEFGINTKTRMLRETADEFKLRRKKYYQPDLNGPEVKWEDEDAQETLVWFLKALDLYGDVIYYACNVTRRNETMVPWNRGSRFYKLDERLKDLTQRLPVDLRLTSSRTNVHISRRTSTSYVLLHSVLTLCNIALHREYLPFLTDPKSGPEGPVDGPMLEEFRSTSTTFWKDSASRCFRATKEFLDLMWTCKQRGVSVETPFTGFVIYHVVFTVIWCAFFPNMDHEGFLCIKHPGRDNRMDFENCDKACNLLNHLQTRVTMARPWCRTLRELYNHLRIATKNYKDWVGNSPGSSTNGSTESSSEYSLRRYEQVEKALKEFGDHQANEESGTADPEQFSVNQDLRHEFESTGQPYSPCAVKSEDGETVEGTPDLVSPSPAQPGFNAINSQNYAQQHHGLPTPTPSHISTSQSRYEQSRPIPGHPASYCTFTAPPAEASRYSVPASGAPYSSTSKERAIANIPGDRSMTTGHYSQENGNYRAGVQEFNQMYPESTWDYQFQSSMDNFSMSNDPHLTTVQPSFFMSPTNYYTANQGT